MEMWYDALSSWFNVGYTAKPFGSPDVDSIEAIQRVERDQEPSVTAERGMTADHLALFTLMTGFIIWATSWLVQMWKPETWKVMSCVSPVGGSLILVGTIMAIADFVVRTHQ
jgi:hypothetical protein